MEFPIGKKLFHLVVNTGTSRCPTVDLELVQTTRKVNGTRHSVRKFLPGKLNELTFLDFPLFLGIFLWDEPTKRVPFTAEPEIPKILTKWKAPTNYKNSFRDQYLALFQIYITTQAVCVTTHKGSWVKLLLCLISMVTQSSSHLVREMNQTQGSKHCCLF